MANNYGDVALGLSPKWDRRDEHNQEYTLWKVGHVNGVADARLKSDPEREHQFAWVDPKRGDEVSKNRVKHYDFVREALWDKNEDLWEWTTDGFCVLYNQYLMARDKSYYLADKDKLQKALANRRDKDSEKARQLAERMGIQYVEDDDEPVIRRRRRAS